MMPHNINNNYYCYFSPLGNDYSYPKICINELAEKGCGVGEAGGALISFTDVPLLSCSFCACFAW